MMGLGLPELMVVLGIALLIFGPRQLPRIGRSIGETIASFRGVGKELEKIQNEGLDADRHDDDYSRQRVAPSYNHGRGDSPLTPCSLCRAQQIRNQRT